MISCKKDGKTFSSSYRKSIYHCLLNQVPVELTGSPISNIVHEMTGSEVDSIADPTTVSQCAYEVGVLNDIQVGEALEHGNMEKNMNTAWDATSLDVEHINEVSCELLGGPSKKPHSTDRCVTG